MSASRSLDGASLRASAFALREGQDYVAAERLFAAGSAALPNDAALAFGLAQTRYELGHDAADLFARAESLVPNHPDIVRNHALALISEGRQAEARDLLESRLARHPDWLDGHKALATLNWTSGDKTGFTDHLAAACRAMPHAQPLWMAWFGNLAQARAWLAAEQVLDEAERHLGALPAIEVSRLFVAVESEAADAQARIDSTAQYRGDIASLCRIRHALRRGEPHRAEAEALPLTSGASAALYWPYLSLAWRLLNDPRAQWLDRPDELIRTFDCGWSTEELENLARTLRALHTAQEPYIEQSVRGGTQTDRSVLLRHEPALQDIKARLLDLMRDYIGSLPPHDPGHPLLSAPRAGRLPITGSWSVRLASQGYNVPHTHAMGWLSTAFYVALPDPERMGQPPAGHIAFGAPPVELGLDLEPYRTIAPLAGRLAVFPSTMWHGTVPFDEGERLVIAFDIGKPTKP
ncbi:putative 2-oxoglutarate-Fe(II)-dependent oxygenase superfamily protein [Novosphingobium kunmingense]|uniref:Putative 2-oxoglutarate-Fe(II)-dependent oxygenase superfamily protein n=1 Tax=Novosphingobium kunmingense TaxID=1211806 RepID=A0A2N0H3H4_9SPHN|nr:putative 2OG-Fe(II) oxygenase [Novosphingobium kunmingense]PKB13478.1 putative 2-oxoglutarate-Fe(II)-dependent oxygenase superfamily protein [Novosphingobium kunmingense]